MAVLLAGGDAMTSESQEAPGLLRSKRGDWLGWLSSYSFRT